MLISPIHSLENTSTGDLSLCNVINQVIIGVYLDLGNFSGMIFYSTNGMATIIPLPNPYLMSIQSPMLPNCHSL